MGVKGRAERGCGILFQRGVWACWQGRFGKVGPMEGLWLVQEDGGEGERGPGGTLVGQGLRVRLQHLI
jgi:hypothetical protein